MVALLNILAVPFSLIYKTVAWIQRRLRARRVHAPKDIFVISVDGIAFGGSGKTPMVIRLGEELSRKKIPFAVITRGYGSRLEKTGGRLDPRRHGPADAGDEACLIQRRLPQAAVWVGRRRVDSLEAAARDGARVAILDDGFQSTHIRRDLKIMLDDPDRPWSYLRHFPRLMREADLYLTRSGARRPARGPAHGTYDSGISGFFDARGKSHDVGETGLFGFSALGDNQRFRRDLEAFNLLGFRPFRDHHAYDAGDLRDLEKRRRAAGAGFLVCTEKDFIKAATAAPADMPLLYAGNRIQLDMDLGDYLWRHVPEKT